MQKKTANELLIFLIPLLTAYLEELSSSSALDENQFCYGEKTAYIECLEIIQSWDNSNKHKLDYNIQQRYL